jgi:hypothetical protein
MEMEAIFLKTVPAVFHGTVSFCRGIDNHRIVFSELTLIEETHAGHAVYNKHDHHY